jgi:hypothetical protein
VSEPELVSVPMVLRPVDPFHLPDYGAMHRGAVRLRLNKRARLTWPEREVLEAVVRTREGSWAFECRLTAILQNHRGEWESWRHVRRS